MKKRIPVLVALLALLVLRGGVRAADDVTANDLKQIGLAYHNHHDATNKAPAKAKDLAPYFENSKRLLDHLESGRIRFIYNVSIRDMVDGTSNTILAHVKEAPAKGGLVLYGDGSVRKLTADEIKKAIFARKR